MRLINVHTLEMEEYFDSNVPPYAILSYTWGQEEVTLREWTAVAQSRKLDPRLLLQESVGVLSHFLGILSFQEIEKKSGYAKILACCEQAKKDNLNYAWVDTCCIDKTSSAELSEAINSMFEWYKSSTICYAYFSDVCIRTTRTEPEVDCAIRDSRWFTRGWTLQEFLAPRKLAFFDSEWKFIQFKSGRVDFLVGITGITSRYINEPDEIRHASVAQRMSWASKRQTTRKEDIAYSLMGIFGINMPLLYGEGDKAFLRLQEEIVRRSGDCSYLAWGYQMPLVRDFDGLFAKSPRDFTGCAEVVHVSRHCSEGITQVTNKGLQIRMSIWTNTYGRNGYAYTLLLCCQVEGSYLLLPIGHADLKAEAEVWRLPGGTPVAMEEGRSCPSTWARKTSLPVFMTREPRETFWHSRSRMEVKMLNIHPELGRHIQLLEVHPPDTWIPGRGEFPINVALMQTCGRLLLKLAPIHNPISASDHVIVVIDFKGTKINEKTLKISRVQSGTIRGDEIQISGTGHPSLAQTLFTESGQGLLRDPMTEFSNKANICGYTLFVGVEQVSEGGFTIKLNKKE